MAKKYLSEEEAAGKLGVKTDELRRLRESGDIRGFADRGTWKFKPEDVDELARSRQAGSDPAVPILGGDEPIVAFKSSGEGSSVILTKDGEGSSVILSDEEDDVGQQPTIIRKEGSGLGGMSASDSDVRLVLDDSLTEDSTPDVSVPKAKKKESDSDVRLVDDSAKPDDSDSDVQLVSDVSDSDVVLVDPASSLKTGDDSDSDVKLVGDASHSDIVLNAGPADAASDSDIKLIGSDIGTERDVALMPSDSAKSAALPDSGISLEAGDSGIALEGADDSGISLMADDDSGIALAADEDSGIALGSPTDSGIALEALAAADSKTRPRKKADLDETQFEFDALEGDSEFELTSSKPASGTGSDTGVIVFDDEAVDEHSPTMVKSSSAAAAAGLGGEAFEFDDGLEVADDVIGEDDELDDVDVFDAGDEDFAQSFAAGESHAEFIAPGAIAAPVQQEWGAATFAGLLLTTVVMAVCAIVMFDFVRSIWSYSEPTGFTGQVMSAFGKMFKN